MDAPVIKFKRVILNRVVVAKMSSDHVAAYWVQYFHDDGTMVFEEKMSFAETAKLVSKDNLANKLNSL